MSRRSVVKIDQRVPLDEAALFGCAVLTGVGAAEERTRILRASKVTRARVANLMESDPALGTLRGVRLDILSTLVASYEQKTFPMDLPDPVEAIKFRMDQQGLKPKDLEPMIGQRNRVYEVLN